MQDQDEHAGQGQQSQDGPLHRLGRFVYRAGSTVVRKIGDVVKGLPKPFKMFMKSSVFGALVGLSYWLVGRYGVGVNISDGLTSGQLTGIFALIVNFLSLVFTTFGAMGWLNTDTVPEEPLEDEQHGAESNLPTGLLGVATASAAITTDSLTIGKSGVKTIGIAGLVTEIGSAMKSFSSLSKVVESHDIDKWEKTKKVLKYLSDLIASLVGAVAFSMSMYNDNGALSVFLAEFVIRGLRAVLTIINTIYSCCRQSGNGQDAVNAPAEAPAEVPALETVAVELPDGVESVMESNGE